MGAYLDNAATAPLRPEALAAVWSVLEGPAGNASGVHTGARAARGVVDEAREVVAAHLGCTPGEVVFTSGGTEGDDLAVNGSVAAAGGGVPVCSAVEHHAVLEPVLALGGRTVPVDGDGVVDLDALADVLRAVDGPVPLVAVLAVGNEVGTIQPLAAVAEVVARHAPSAVLHTDAVQAAAWLTPDAWAPAALVTVSGHKLGGPTGVGALVVRAGTALRARLLGGGQERGRRSGTSNVAGIAGLAAALEATSRDREAVVARTRALRDRLVDGLVATVPGCRETVGRDAKVAGSCHLLVDGVDAEALLVLLDRAGVAASAGSSCASGALEPSHVLAALGVDRRAARGALRLSLGWSTTDADVDLALAVVPEAVARLRALDPVGPAPVAAGGAR